MFFYRKIKHIKYVLNNYARNYGSAYCTATERIAEILFAPLG